MHTLLQNTPILETFKCEKIQCVSELSNMSKVIIIVTMGVGMVTYQNIKMWGRMCLRSGSYSCVIIVTTGVGTRRHWNPPEEACKATWGQQMRLPAGAAAERPPSRQTVVDKVGKEAREGGSRQREQLWQRKATKTSAVHSGSSCLGSWDCHYQPGAEGLQCRGALDVSHHKDHREGDVGSVSRNEPSLPDLPVS